MAGRLRAAGPLWLWTGIVAGPVAWLVNLTVNDALAPVACARRTSVLLNAVALLAFVVTVAGWFVSWSALRTAESVPAATADSHDLRRRFMALLGLGVAALFAVQIVAGAFPQWILDVCD
ncbi:MAG: hypothetical protein U0Q11_22200 [Vicinamibacterales bacterium]